MSAVTSHDCHRAATPPRVLLAVHGGEPDGWGRETRRIVAMWDKPSIRILAVLAVPRPPFTSLIPPAAGMYRAARAAWRDAEGKRLQQMIDELTPVLRPGAGDVVWAPVTHGDAGRTIVEHARAWATDVLLMAVTPAAGLWLRAVHERVVRHAGYPVLLTPAPDPGREA